MKLMLSSAFAALALGLTAASASPPDGAPNLSASSPAEAAWRRYRDTLAAQHDALLKNPYAQDPLLRAQGLYFLQSEEVSAFNMYVAPRQQYPALYKQSIYMPFELSWGLPSPDFLYRQAYIDGAHNYRIYGNKKGNFWTTIQVFRALWGDGVAETQTLTNIDFDQVPSKPDGSFEIFLGPNPPQNPDGRYWVKLDPERHNITLLVREVFYDWTRTAQMDMHIEALDRADNAAIYVDESDLASRIDKGTNFISYNFDFTMRELNKWTKRPRNTFIKNETTLKDGGNPLACYIGMLYDISPDEALIIESPMVEARYWSIQLGTVWEQTIDYSYHQSSLNAAQAKLDADGRFRAVLALKDPGVPNWLDPAGVPLGVAVVRFYKSQYCIAPSVQKVKLADLRRYLPSDTPVVTPAQRVQELTTRRVASLRRYEQ
jgi:hypothetical protein